MNKKLLPIFGFLFASAPLVFAANFFDSNPIIRSFADILGAQVKWPPWNATPGIPVPTITVPIYVILLTWIMTFALIHILIQQIKVFQDTQSKNAVLWFSIAFSGIAVTSTSFVNNVAALVDFSQGSLSMIVFIIVFFLLIGLLISGSKLGLGMASPGRWGTTEQINTERERKKVLQDAKVEDDTYRRENQGIRQAETLIAQDIMALTNEQDQFRRLAEIVKQLSSIRQGNPQAETLKQGFDRQASAISAKITNEINLETKEVEIDSQIQRLTDVDFAMIGRLQTEQAALTAAGPPATGTNEAKKLATFKREEIKLVKLDQQKGDLLRKIKAARQSFPTNSIGKLISNIIADVHQSNYPKATQEINEALSEIGMQKTVLQNIDTLFKQIDQLVGDQQAILLTLRKAGLV